MNYDTSNELCLQHWRSGIKLVTPEDHTDCRMSIGELFKLPMSVYFLRAGSIIEKINEINAQEFAMGSPHAAKGKSIDHFINWQSASRIMANDKAVMEFNKAKITEELAITNTCNEINCLSFKFPWFNDNNHIIGLFGCSIIFAKHNLSLAMQNLLALGLLTSEKFASPLKNKPSEFVKFTKRQNDCVQLLIRGKTVKEIADILHLSKRTVEGYIIAIKLKLNVDTKSELIDKLFYLINK